MAFELTDHARNRCEERQIPETVLERLQDGAFVAKALEDDGRISNMRIVRVARDRYWVAIERDEHFITVIHVGFDGLPAREWFRRRLLDFRHVIDSIEALPVTSTKKLGRQHAYELLGRKDSGRKPVLIPGPTFVSSLRASTTRSKTDKRHPVLRVKAISTFTHLFSYWKRLVACRQAFHEK